MTWGKLLRTIRHSGGGFGITAGLALGAAAVVSCSPGSGEGLDQNGRPLGENDPTVPLTAQLASIQQNVLTPNCAISGCHTGAAAPQGLRLDDANSFALLVGIPSNEVPGLLRVDPGNPDRSYLIQKLEGTAAAGERMPLNGPPFLPQKTIDVIRQWITDGALPDRDQAAAPTVVSVAPTAGSRVDTLSAGITIVFSDDIDASLLNTTIVKLLGSGGDGSFTDGNEFIVDATSMELAKHNSRLLTIAFSGNPSTPDSYQLRLMGGGATALASTTGLLLDGDNDGLAGGDFTSIFNIYPGPANDLTSSMD
jgi:hypothetical protein